MVTRITEALEKPITKANFMFLSDSLPVINVFNKVMQQQSPTIHCLHQEVTTFMKKLLLRFMQPQAVQDDISTINVKDSNKYIQLSDVFTGDQAKSYVEECDDLSTSDIKQFRENCRNFWIATAEYAIKKLPFSNELLKNVSWMLPSKQDLELEDQVLGVAAELPQVIPAGQKSAGREEFMDYCTYQMPSFITRITDIASYSYEVASFSGLSQFFNVDALKNGKAWYLKSREVEQW